MITWFRVLLLLLGLSIFWAPMALLHSMDNLIDLIRLIDIPSFIFVFGPSIILLFFFHKPKQLLLAIGHLGFIDAVEQESLRISLKVWRHWGILLVVCGVINTGIGIWLMAKYLSDPNAVIPSVKLALLATQYGVLLATVLAFPAYLIVERRLNSSRSIHKKNAPNELQ